MGFSAQLSLISYGSREIFLYARIAIDKVMDLDRFSGIYRVLLLKLHDWNGISNRPEYNVKSNWQFKDVSRNWTWNKWLFPNSCEKSLHLTMDRDYRRKDIHLRPGEFDPWNLRCLLSSLQLFRMPAWFWPDEWILRI